MTVKEASKTVEDYLPDCDTRKFVLDILARAEKKKPAKIDSEERTFDCPACDSTLYYEYCEMEDCSFCPCCGQALDWGDVK